MATDPCECIVPPPDEPPRQGDIFVWSDWQHRDRMSRAGLILTADCDIAQGKTSGFLTFVPVVTLDDYLCEVWARDKLEKVKTRALNHFGQFVQKCRQEIDSTATPLSHTALQRWVETSTVDDISTELSIDTGKQPKQLQHYHDLISSLIQAEPTDSSDPSWMMKQLVEASAIQDKVSQTDSSSSVKKHVRNELRNLPQDAFFVGLIPTIPKGLASAPGFIARLRYIYPLPQSDLLSSLAEARERGSVAVRIARLSSTYKHAVAQQFALLFSRIGLSPEYEQQFEEIIEYHPTVLATSGASDD